MSSNPAPTHAELDTSRIRAHLALAYFIVPLMVTGVAYYMTDGELFVTSAPVHWWRLTYCFLAGFWGLAIRTLHLLEKFKNKSPWRDG